MNEVIIRRLEKDDIESLERLYRQFWNDRSDINMMHKKFSDLSGNDDYIFLAAEVDNRIAGSIMGIVCHELYGKCRPFLLMEDLVVDESFRNIGVGKKLVNALENIARNKDCYQILFMTESDRKNTIGFYESIGFDSSKNTGFKRQLS